MVSVRQPFSGEYIITLDFGEKFPPLYTDESPHQGIDYGTPLGTPILASADGTVDFTANLTVGYGKYIRLRHQEGYISLYAHLSEINVREGQAVSKGQVIGKSGSTGNSTGPHLHFEVRKNNVVIDPKTVLQSVFDTDPINNTPTPVKPQFERVESGSVIVVCDVANVRCHCDMNRVIDQKKKGDILMISGQPVIWNGLPYRDYWDGNKGCWLRIAEHDPYDQMIVNYEI